MSQLSAKLNRLDGISASLERDGGSVSACLVPVPQMTASLCRDDDELSFSFDRKGDMSVAVTRKECFKCVLEYTDRADVMAKYLEIEPELLWVYPDLSNYNNVYSNVTWIVN